MRQTRQTRRAWSRAFQAAAFAAASTLTAACAVESTGTATEPSAPAGSSEPSAADGTKRSAETVHPVATEHQCSKLATPPGGYPNDPLEDALTALGCTPPAAYSESLGDTETWLYVDCPAKLDLLFVVGRYAGAPYRARFSTSSCLLPTVRPGHVIVEFDPTCDSCVLAQ